MSGSMDLGFLKQAIHDLRDSIKTNTQVISEYKNAIDMSNLLKMVELGIISKEDIVGSSFYESYINHFIVQDKTKKKSLFK